MSKTNRPNPWQLEKEFYDEALGLCVRVKRFGSANTYRNRGNAPRYSLEAGGIHDGKFTPYLTPAYGVTHARVSMRQDGMAMARLLDEALLYVADRLQAHEDFLIEMKQRQELRDIERADRVGSKPGQGLARFKMCEGINPPGR